MFVFTTAFIDLDLVKQLKYLCLYNHQPVFFSKDLMQNTLPGLEPIRTSSSRYRVLSTCVISCAYSLLHNLTNSDDVKQYDCPAV